MNYISDPEEAVQTPVVNIPAGRIVDWDSFHDVFSETLGFPGFYGGNMNAWIDCLTCADDAEGGMVANPVASGDLLTLSIVEVALCCPSLFPSGAGPPHGEERRSHTSPPVSGLPGA